ncbi:hypothetical protein [Paramicrobacterium chengjingii]|uniref:Uncharacterized protein n=1 Tax=Paramicrobacterium chengjingii TaxID=2769067 RepID=A0ABX6YJ91_9MICO|nr:hypothetical protein [Microbacterium chengjingii]QPZ38476.1 hypothetical protein HCR76_17125 [Microbacterium chengjingii]
MKFRTLVFAVIVGGICFSLGVKSERGEFDDAKKRVKAWSTPALKEARKRARRVDKQLSKKLK